jgi:hypothetical protein
MDTGELDRSASGREDRLYFGAVSVVSLLLILWAFGPSYFLRSLYHQPDPPPFIIIHGALMTGWVLLFVVQTTLVSARHVSWHMKLGYAGLLYAALLVPIGCIAVTISTAREVHGHTSFMLPQLNVFGLSLMQMFLFGGYVGAAGLLRSRPDFHKRLIVMATLSVLPNAIVRLSFNVPIFSFIQTNLDILNTWAALCLAIIAVDFVRLRRLHPVFAVGGVLALVALYLTWFIGQTPAWNQFWIRSFS